MSFEVCNRHVSSWCQNQEATILQTSLIISARRLYSANTSASSCESPFPTRFWYGFGSSADMVVVRVNCPSKVGLWFIAYCFQLPAEARVLWMPGVKDLVGVYEVRSAASSPTPRPV